MGSSPVSLPFFSRPFFFWLCVSSYPHSFQTDKNGGGATNAGPLNDFLCPTSLICRQYLWLHQASGNLEKQIDPDTSIDWFVPDWVPHLLGRGEMADWFVQILSLSPLSPSSRSSLLKVSFCHPHSRTYRCLWDLAKWCRTRRWFEESSSVKGFGENR